MRAETIYYAFDETPFSSEEACLEYEKMLGSVKHCVKWFDLSLKSIKDTDLDKIESDGMYCYVIGPEANKYFDWLNNELGLGTPDCLYDDGDILEFDSSGDWMNITKTFNEYAHIIITVQKEIERQDS